MHDEHYLFIQRRYDATPEAHSMFKVHYHGMLGSEINASVEEGHTSYPAGLKGEFPRPDDPILAYEAVLGLTNIVEGYCLPGSDFVTFVHDYDHALYHPHDYLVALTLPEVLGCTREQLFVVRCDLSEDGGTVDLNKFTFDAYFSDLLT